MDQTKAGFPPVSGLTLLTGVGLLGVIALVVIGLINEYNNSVHAAQTEVKTLTRLLEGHASATVDKIDLLLREVQRHARPVDLHPTMDDSAARQQELHQLLKSLKASVPEAEGIHISDAQGDPIHSSEDKAPRISIRDRYHFLYQRDHPDAGLVMSPALFSRSTGKWTVALSRRLNFADGQFAGVVHAILNPMYFQQFYQTLDLNNHGLVALYDESWHLLARFPASETSLGQKIDLDVDQPLEKEVNQSSFIAKSHQDGVNRLYSYRKVGQLPLYVLSAIAEDGYLAEWQRHVWQYGLGTLIFSVAIIRFSWRQRRADKALRHNEENLRIIADHTYDWEYWEGAEHDIRYMSPACQRVTGYSPQEFINTPALIHQIVHPDDQHVLQTHSHDSPSDLAEVSFRIVHRDGSIRWITHGCQAVYGKAGQYLGRRVCNRDETERKKLERMAKEFEAIVQSSNDAVIGKSLDGTITSWNHGAEALFGYSAEEMIGRHMNQLLPADRFEEENFILKHIAAGKTVQHLETVRVHKSGKLIDISVTFSPIHDNNGKVIGISKVARDITDHKKAESALRRASLYARSLLEASLDPLVTISPEGKITDVNRATEVVTGHQRQDLIGSDFSSYFTDPSEASRGYQKVFSEGRVKDYPLAIRHVSGAVTEVLYNANLYRTETGEVAGVFAAARDITERKQAEEALRRASLYARSLIEASLDPLVTISPEGKITDVNRATEVVTGHQREDLIGSDFSSYFTDPSEASRGYQKVFSEGRVKDYPLAIRHASGAVTEVLYNASLYRTETGEVAGVFAAARDITERKKAEDEIKHLAFFDPLTKLANRRMLHEHLKQAMAASKRTGQYGAVMLLDLDNFKPLNDLHGHDAGDLLLVEVARRLKSCVRETDTVARVGGDEFVVLIGQLNTDPERSAAQASTMAEKIRAVLSQPYAFSIEHEGAAASTVEH